MNLRHSSIINILCIKIIKLCFFSLPYAKPVTCPAFKMGSNTTKYWSVVPDNNNNDCFLHAPSTVFPYYIITGKNSIWAEEGTFKAEGTLFEET